MQDDQTSGRPPASPDTDRHFETPRVRELRSGSRQARAGAGTPPISCPPSSSAEAASSPEVETDADDPRPGDRQPQAPSR